MILPAEEKLGRALVIRYGPSLSYFTVLLLEVPEVGWFAAPQTLYKQHFQR